MPKSFATSFRNQLKLPRKSHPRSATPPESLTSCPGAIQFAGQGPPNTEEFIRLGSSAMERFRIWGYEPWNGLGFGAEPQIGLGFRVWNCFELRRQNYKTLMLSMPVATIRNCRMVPGSTLGFRINLTLFYSRY